MQDHNVFQAKFSRLPLLRDETKILTGLRDLMGFEVNTFNRGISELTATGKILFTDKGFGGLADTSPAPNTAFDAAAYHIFKPPAFDADIWGVGLYVPRVAKEDGKEEVKEGKKPCNCGEQTDALYLAFSPPTNKEAWDLILDASLEDKKYHQGFARHARKILPQLLQMLRTVNTTRLLGLADDPNLLSFPVYVSGYSFGGSFAQVVALKLTHLVSVAINVHLTTFGAPLAATLEAPVGQLRSFRRYAHAGDPFAARLMSPSRGYKSLVEPLADDNTVVQVNYKTGSKGAMEICRSLGCHTAYLGVDFRETGIQELYASMPVDIISLLLPGAPVDISDLWRAAYNDSVLLTAEGVVPAHWQVNVSGKGSKEPKGSKGSTGPRGPTGKR